MAAAGVIVRSDLEPGALHGAAFPSQVSTRPHVTFWLTAQSAAQGRVAMMAAAGVILVELAGLGPWYEAPFKASACPSI